MIVVEAQGWLRFTVVVACWLILVYKFPALMDRVWLVAQQRRRLVSPAGQQLDLQALPAPNQACSNGTQLVEKCRISSDGNITKYRTIYREQVMLNGALHALLVPTAIGSTTNSAVLRSDLDLVASQ